MEVMQSSYTESFPTASSCPQHAAPRSLPSSSALASIFYPVHFFSFPFKNILPLKLCHGGCARPAMAPRKPWPAALPPELWSLLILYILINLKFSEELKGKLVNEDQPERVGGCSEYRLGQILRGNSDKGGSHWSGAGLEGGVRHSQRSPNHCFHPQFNLEEDFTLFRYQIWGFPLPWALHHLSCQAGAATALQDPVNQAPVQLLDVELPPLPEAPHSLPEVRAAWSQGGRVYFACSHPFILISSSPSLQEELTEMSLSGMLSTPSTGLSPSTNHLCSH